MSEHKNVTEALAAVMSELPGIGKDGKADPQQGGYSYRGIEHITAHAQELLGRHGVVPYPRVVGDPVITQIVVRDKPWTDTMLKVEYRFKHGPSDTEELAGPFVGIGRDNSDKGANKAMTQTFKYALIQVLCIGDKSDDADGQSIDADERHGPALTGPPWYQQLGYESANQAQETNDALKVLVDSALRLPREARDPMKKWLADNGYDTWLPVALADASGWEAVLREVLEDPKWLSPEGEPDFHGGAGAPSEGSDPPPAKKARGTTKKAGAKPTGVSRDEARARVDDKRAEDGEQRSEYLDNGELRITDSMRKQVMRLFTMLDESYTRDQRIRYMRNVLDDESIGSTWDLSVGQASTVIDNLKVVVGEEPPPREQ